MSSDWPTRPDLEAALEAEASRAKVRSEHRAHVAQQLYQDVHTSTRPRLHFERGQRLLVAAVLLAIVGIGGAWILGTGSQSEVAVATAAPEYDCEGLGPQLAPWRVGVTEIGASGGGSLLSYVSVTDDSWRSAAARQRIHVGPVSIDSAFAYAGSAVDEAVEAERLSCTAATFLVAEGLPGDAQSRLLCASSRHSRGYAGFVLVQPADPPKGCEAARSVMLVAPDADIEGAWAEHLGCGGFEESEGERRWLDCRQQLLVADVPSPVWEQSVDDVPVRRWILGIAELGG